MSPDLSLKFSELSTIMFEAGYYKVTETSGIQSEIRSIAVICKAFQIL